MAMRLAAAAALLTASAPASSTEAFVCTRKVERPRTSLQYSSPLDAIRKRRTDFAPIEPAVALEQRLASAARAKAAVRRANGQKRRGSKKRANAVHAPNPVMDQFEPKYSNHLLEILPPSASDSLLAGGGATVEGMPLSENEEALSMKEEVDRRVAELLGDDDGEEDEESHPDASDEAANEIAEGKSVKRMSEVARFKANEAMSKSTTSAASLAGDIIEGPGQVLPGKAVKARNRAGQQHIRATVQETGRDTIQSYTKTLTNHELLSREAEVLLGKQIQVLVKWEDERQKLEEELLRAPTYAQWADAVGVSVPDLKKQIRKSHRAKAALVEANLRLVVTVARQTVKKHRTEINFHDACQQGIVGLTRACEKFDPTKDFRFSTYAMWWIKGEMHKSITDQTSPIRIPANVRKKVNEIRINERILMAELGRKPTDEEVAGRSGMTREQLLFYRKRARDVQSIDQKVTSASGKGSQASGDSARRVTEVGELVSDDGPSPAEAASAQMLQDDVRRLVKTLSPREQAVVRMRFGLDDGKPKTLREIGEKFGVDVDKIRKVEARALLKLRQPYRNQSVKCYVSDL